MSTNTPTFTGDLITGYVDAAALGAARTEKPGNDYRLARTAAGELVLQRSYYWSEGSSGGIDWRTVPIVQLDAEGNAP